MKTAHSQKGFSPLVIIIIGIVALVLIALLINTWVAYSFIQSKTASSNNQLSNQQTQTSTQSIPNLEKIESNTYTFYYPKSYVKTDKKLPINGKAADIVQLYVKDNKSEIKEGIKLVVERAATRATTPTTESCQELAVFSMRGKLNPKLVDAGPVDYVKSHGCIILYVASDSNNTKWDYYEKYLSYKEGSDTYFYDILSAYLANTPQEEQNKIKLAVDSFILK